MLSSDYTALNAVIGHVNSLLIPPPLLDVLHPPGARLSSNNLMCHHEAARAVLFTGPVPTHTPLIAHHALLVHRGSADNKVPRLRQAANQHGKQLLLKRHSLVNTAHCHNHTTTTWPSLGHTILMYLVYGYSRVVSLRCAAMLLCYYAVMLL